MGLVRVVVGGPGVVAAWLCESESGENDERRCIFWVFSVGIASGAYGTDLNGVTLVTDYGQLDTLAVRF